MSYSYTGIYDRPTFDQQDAEILAQRQESILARKGPIQGDFIRFQDGSLKRIAHVWRDENDNPEYIQPTYYDGDGSFYLGNGYMSYSGSLDTGIPWTMFAPTTETIPGHVWFFHHDYPRCQGGVQAKVNCHVWHCYLALAKK